ncbi:MAG: hemin-degrading factor [Cyclobacteriaceae bacterium]|nr:hemin-degrading factor [Cyclobacteriaceae bacterium]
MIHPTLDNLSKDQLTSSWENLRRENPKLRIRDAATRLGVSEAILLSTRAGQGVTRLDANPIELFQDIKAMGRIMSLTRNDACVLEHHGTLQKIDIIGSMPNAMATVIGPIELRVFFKSWQFFFAVEDPKPTGGFLRSIQVFDRAGDAIIKMYLQDDEKLPVFQDILEKYKHPDQQQSIETEVYPQEVYSNVIDETAFQQAWLQMKDTHDFFGMLKDFGISRKHALEIAPEGAARKIDPASIKSMLETAANTKLPIMIFAGNRGNIQIHQGKVRTIRELGSWLNVLDPDFNMHLNMAEITEAWIVKKSTSDGLVSSIELFNAKHELMAQFFGLRKPGIPEKEAWREILETLN